MIIVSAQASKTLRREIIATREQFQEYIVKLAEEHRTWAQQARLQRDKRYQAGIAAGLQLAADAMRDWKQTVTSSRVLPASETAKAE